VNKVIVSVNRDRLADGLPSIRLKWPDGRIEWAVAVSVNGVDIKQENGRVWVEFNQSQTIDIIY